MLFSGVAKPKGNWSSCDESFKITVPSVHVYDQEEEFADECVQLQDRFNAATASVIHHSQGHTVPNDVSVCEGIAAFVAFQMTGGGP